MTFQISAWWLLAGLLSSLGNASLADALHTPSPLRSTIQLQRNFRTAVDGFAAKISTSEASKSALFQSKAVDTMPLRRGYVGTVETRWSMCPDRILQGRAVAHKFCISAAKSGFNILKRCWWALPMALAVVPVYSALVWNIVPAMPHWWPLTNMEQLLSSPSWGFIVTVFLSSNLFYFASGAYLLGRFSWSRKAKLLKGFPMLGGLTLTAGVVSTVFHYFQALGSFQIAEALCYLDHAVACSSILYFWHRCGRPGLAASLMAAAGFATLAITDPIAIYPYLHSAWHALSAGAAVFWANDGVKRRLHMLEQIATVPATV